MFAGTTKRNAGCDTFLEMLERGPVKSGRGFQTYGRHGLTRILDTRGHVVTEHTDDRGHAMARSIAGKNNCFFNIFKDFQD
eukprot:4720985-Prymnesium_polylepis.1